MLRHVQGGKAKAKIGYQPKPDIGRRVKPDGVIQSAIADADRSGGGAVGGTISGL